MSKVVNVAVAVIHFNNQYLLGFRHANQHQGNRYEFVGGKIEPNETPTQGLIREVVEEIGCDLTNNFIVKMGVIRHDYGDKSVALHIFNSKVTQTQFDNLQHSQGIEGQAITWVSKADLLAKKYPLPDANVRILDWLTLPSTIFISQTLDEFASQKDWIDYYAKKLPQNAHFYIRPQSEDDKSVELITTLLKQRNHITPIIQYRTFIHLDLDLQNVIVHLNHHQLMTLDFSSLSKNYRYFASCHDQHSLSKINELAKTHVVMGCFLSPVLATPTHPETFQSGGMGWQAFSELAKLSDVPVFALGGVGQSNLAMAWLSNAYGVAGIRLLVYKTMNF